ncbi:glycoside hydrolase family 78 protein [Flavobacteriaceae bacterium]|nr:glycoside hydrolase family 78 protein [Flavobacteriaceae bacterium]MDA9015458.1 glycoside hydrolase family 78 protein [Flavobacteriaceae bacterium]
MNKRTALLIVLMLISVFGIAQSAYVKDLKVNQLSNPLGLDDVKPHFSWKIESSKQSVEQTQYQIKVWTENTNQKIILWDSGKVNSSNSVYIPYQGPPLESNQTYHWNVEIQLNQDAKTYPSDYAFWSMGLLSPSDWNAEWIGPSKEYDIERKSPYLRTDFKLKKKTIAQAYLHITAKGMYEAYLNGERIGDHYLSPGWTSYKERIPYQTFDVKELLKEQNGIGIVLGSGWYRGYLAWGDANDHYGSEIATKAQLMITYTDGTSEQITTNPSWTYTHGAIVDSEIYNGELFDAQKNQKEWSNFGFSVSNSRKAVQITPGTERLIASRNEPIRKQESFEVIEKIKTPSGDTVFDFGQNLVGWIEFKHQGKAGDTIRLYHAEILDKEGEFYTENLRAAKQMNTYILNGDPNFIYRPHFTFQGFRYLKIESSNEVNPSDFKAVALYSDMLQTGTLETSNSLINKLQQNIQWGQKGNFLDVPTDCPQRDERLGWTGDAQAFFNTAAFNFDVKNFFDKWLIDLSIDQREDGSVPFVVPNVLGKDAMGSAGWADAATIIPWNAYLYYGDKTSLSKQYPSMKRWVSYMQNLAKDGIYKGGFHFGDWLFYRPNDDNDGRSAVTNKELIAQCFYAYSTEILMKAASELGHQEESKAYQDQLSQIKAAFVSEFMTPNGRLISETQTAYVLSLHFNLIPETLIPRAVDRLVENIKSYGNHLTTGFLGTPYLCHVLSENGRADVAIDLLLQKSYPSWLYPVTQGATTIWERWDGLKPDGTTQTPSMNSYNHYAYGAIGEWMYRQLLGIQIDEKHAGFKHFFLKPIFPKEFDEVKGSYESLYGKIGVHWKQNDDNLTLSVEIPANTSATLELPNEVGTWSKAIDNNRNLKFTSVTQNQQQLGSGKYVFRKEK